MPRARLTSTDVVAAAAGLADEAGFRQLTMGLVARRLGIRTPSLYKHIADLADLRHRVATMAMNEMGDAIRDALPGRSGRDALAALLAVIQAYVTAHPGRYPATTGARSPARTTRCWPPPPASSTPSPPRCAATASATRTWCTPSAPSAAPSTDSPCGSSQTASNGTENPATPSTG